MNVVVLVTAFPTTDHVGLIDFAASLPNAQVHVLVCARVADAYPGSQRLAAVSQCFNGRPNVVVRLLEDDGTAQTWQDHPDLWAWWTSKIHASFPAVNEWSYCVAAESYGADIARSLGARFMPFGQIISQQEHQDPWSQWRSLLPLTRQRFQCRAVVFGPESVGKTSLARAVSARLSIAWTPEYARPYLETIAGPCDMRAMEEIYMGQRSLQSMAFDAASSPAVVLDTDLFSTVGYYPLMNETCPDHVLQDAYRLQSHCYYLLPDHIAFEADPIRYGGDQRESDSAYWDYVLRRYDLPYLSVPAGSLQEQADFIAEDLRGIFDREVNAFMGE